MSQSVAHAGLCKLTGKDLIHGPYSCILPPILYAIWGTSRHGSVGTGSLVGGVEEDRGRRKYCEIFIQNEVEVQYGHDEHVGLLFLIQ